MSPTEISLLVTAVTGFISAVVMGVRLRSQSKTEKKSGDTVDRTALAAAVETVQEVYGKLTGDLRIQVDDLLARDRECRSELEQAKADLRALRERVANHAVEIDQMRVTIHNGNGDQGVAPEV